MIDFIKNFSLSSYGLNFWDLCFLFGITILMFILGNWFASTQQPPKSQRIKRALMILFNTTFYLIISFALIHSILTGNKERLIIIIFILLLPNLKLWVENFYKKYDEFVDRTMNK